MATTQQRLHEERARLAKAHTIVTFLQANGGDLADSDTVAELSDARWAEIAGMAGVHIPSEATRRQVVDMLASAERIASAVIDDPFAGL